MFSPLRRITDALRRVRPSIPVFAFVLALVVMPVSADALLVTGENANDILGEFTTPSSDTTADYVKGCPNNGASSLGLNETFSSDGNPDVVIDTTYNRLFVADSANNRVLVFTLNGSAQIVSKTPANVLGEPDFVTCAAATTQAGMNTPGGLDFDATNNRLFVADSANNRVLVFSTASIANGMNASYELGQASGGTAFTTATPNTTQSGLNTPYDVKYDSANTRLFVADYSNNRVMVFNTSSISNGETAAYELGQASGGSAFTTGTANDTQSTMSGPLALSYDSTDTLLWVSEYGNNRLTTWNVAPGTIANGENAANVLGQLTFTTNAAATTQAGLEGPDGVSYDATNARVFVADAGNNRVLDFNTSNVTNGENASDVLGQFNSPSVDTTADYVKACPNNGASPLGFSMNGAVNPDGVIDTVNHRLFVADAANNRVLVFTLNGSNQISSKTAANVLGQADFITCLPNQTNGNPFQSSMDVPSGVDFDATNNRLFVADAGNNRVLVFNTASITNGMNASYELGQASGSAFTAHLGATTQSGINDPLDVKYDSVNNRLFVADYNNNRVLVFNTSSISNGENASYELGQADFTHKATADTQAGMNGPDALSYDSTDTLLYVSESVNNRVMTFNAATGSIANGENASNVFGQLLFTTKTAAATQAGMSNPDGVAYDSTNNRLFVSEYGNNRATVFSTSNVINGENASDILGQFTSPSVDTTADYVKACPNNGASPLGFDISATASGGPAPPGSAIDATHHYMYVSDTLNHRVLVYTLNSSTNLISSKTPAYVLGQPDFVSCEPNQTNTTTPGKNTLYNPSGLAIDVADQLLYVADNHNNRVMVFNVSSISNGMNASYELGQTNFTNNSNACNTAAVMYSPFGLAFDSANNRLFVVLDACFTVYVYNTGSLSNGMNASYVLGASTFTTGAGTDNAIDIKLSHRRCPRYHESVSLCGRCRQLPGDGVPRRPRHDREWRECIL